LNAPHGAAAHVDPSHTHWGDGQPPADANAGAEHIGTSATHVADVALTAQPGTAGQVVVGYVGHASGLHTVSLSTWHLRDLAFRQYVTFCASQLGASGPQAAASGDATHPVTTAHCVMLYATQGSSTQRGPTTRHCGPGHCGTECESQYGVKGWQVPHVACVRQPATAAHCVTLYALHGR
jgi:hypothetical protein